jgi:hypothetical protein
MRVISGLAGGLGFSAIFAFCSWANVGKTDASSHKAAASGSSLILHVEVTRIRASCFPSP